VTSGVRVALISEGTDPYRGGAVETWCQRLVAGLAEHDFHRVAVLDTQPPRSTRAGRTVPAPRTAPPATPGATAATAATRSGGGTTTTIHLAGKPVGPDRGPATHQHRREATHAAVLLCRGMLEESPHSAEMFRSALRRLAVIAADGTHPLGGVPLAAVLLDAWRAGGGPPATVGRLTGRSPSTGMPWPALRDAQVAARLLEHAVRALCTAVPDVELCHAANGGLSTLVALGAKWRQAIPYVLTEHDLYLRAPLMRRDGGRPAVRAILLRFLRSLTRLGYAEAAAIALPTERMRRWAMRHGAGREVLRVVPPGVDPGAYPQLREEPGEPVVVWLGPDGDLPGTLAAFDMLRRTVPDARLVVAGPPPRGARPERVDFTGPVTGRREAYALGRIVVVSGAHDAMPYPLIEAMLCGRPTVCIDNGGLAAMVGMGAMVAPPGDPHRLAAVCASLLADARLRRELATAARHRARTLFTLNAMIEDFRTEYARVADQRPAPRPPAVRREVPA
jgi:glycosyltransferase involved in cell wall biosynthesis